MDSMNMEAIFAASSTEQSFSSSPYRNHPSKRNTRDFSIYRPTENLVPTNYIIHGGNGGFLFAPPPSISFSYPPPSPVMYPNQQNQRQPAQPPLLPLPISKPRHNSLPSRSRDLSCPPIARKPNRPRSHSLTPKKSKNPINKRDEVKKAQLMDSSSTVPVGPDRKDLPKVVSKVLSALPPSSFSSMAGNVNNLLSIEDLERFSGSMFTPSPHPSSLPLPKFSVKPKLSCTAEAAGADNGATDNLHRLLRLR